MIAVDCMGVYPLGIGFSRLLTDTVVEGAGRRG